MEQKICCGGFYLGEGLALDGRTLKATPAPVSGGAIEIKLSDFVEEGLIDKCLAELGTVFEEYGSVESFEEYQSLLNDAYENNKSLVISDVFSTTGAIKITNVSIMRLGNLCAASFSGEIPFYPDDGSSLKIVCTLSVDGVDETEYRPMIFAYAEAVEIEPAPK